MENKGTAQITGSLHMRNNPSVIFATAQLTVKNGWQDIFNLSKSFIRTVPKRTESGTLDSNPLNIAYQINPSAAYVIVKIADHTKLKLKQGTYSTGNDLNIPGISHSDPGVFVITPDKLDHIDNETGTGYGYIQFDPTGETNAAVTVQCYNPIGTNPQNGLPNPYFFPENTTSITMQIYYSDYTFIPRNVTTTRGKSEYNYFDEASGSFVVGDFNRITFEIDTLEENATPNYQTAEYFSENSNEMMPQWIPSEHRENEIYKDIYMQGRNIEAGRESDLQKYYIKHNFDYRGSGDATVIEAATLSGDALYLYFALLNSAPYTNVKPIPQEDTNRTITGYVLAGEIRIPYKVFNSATTKYAVFPVYVAIRNCPYTY
jgi:hypothetical protein